MAEESFSGTEWESQTAERKEALLWGQVTSNTESDEFPSSIKQGELLIESMKPPFEVVGDEFKKHTGVLGISERQKLVHSVGCVGKCQYISLGEHPYTGLFKGMPHGLIRLSMAAKPVTSEPVVCIPGLALKGLIDGIPSANLLAMFQLGGQHSFNFFLHDFTNHPPAPGKDQTSGLKGLKTKIILKKFEGASKWPNMIGLLSFASRTHDGREEPEVRFPWRLIFHPTSELHRSLPDEDSEGRPFTAMLQGVTSSGTTLYEVFAVDSPQEEGSPQLIGKVVLTSGLSTSKFGDAHLFFHHNQMENDFVHRPEWTHSADEISHQQTNAEDTFHYPDLAW